MEESSNKSSNNHDADEDGDDAVSLDDDDEEPGLAHAAADTDLLVMSPTTLLNELTGESPTTTSFSPATNTILSPTTHDSALTSPTTFLNSLLNNTTPGSNTNNANNSSCLPANVAEHLPPMPPLGIGGGHNSGAADDAVVGDVLEHSAVVMDFDAILASVGKSNEDDDDDEEERTKQQARPSPASMQSITSNSVRAGGGSSAASDDFFTPYQSEADTDDDVETMMIPIITMVPSTVTEESTSSNTAQIDDAGTTTTDAVIQEIMQDMDQEYQQFVVNATSLVAADEHQTTTTTTTTTTTNNTKAITKDESSSVVAAASTTLTKEKSEEPLPIAEISESLKGGGGGGGVELKLPGPAAAFNDVVVMAATASSVDKQQRDSSTSETLLPPSGSSSQKPETSSHRRTTDGVEDDDVNVQVGSDNNNNDEAVEMSIVMEEAARTDRDTKAAAATGDDIQDTVLHHQRMYHQSGTSGGADFPKEESKKVDNKAQESSLSNGAQIAATTTAAFSSSDVANITSLDDTTTRSQQVVVGEPSLSADAVEGPEGGQDTAQPEPRGATSEGEAGDSPFSMSKASNVDAEVPTRIAAAEEDSTRIISAMSTEDVIEELLNGEEPAISPLTQKPSLGPSRGNDVFRPRGPQQPKPKALQVEFPSALDSSWKKSDAVSLSSASSTISHGSTNRGLMSSGVISPSTTEEAWQRRGSGAESRPPRVPKKGKEANMSPKSFIDSLSKRLIVQDVDESTGHDDMDPVGTRWIKQSRATSFNPKKSIFAGKVGTSSTPDISPPGSPPEPVYAYSGLAASDEASSSDDESQDMSSGAASADLGPEAGTWDMIAEDAAGLSAPPAVEQNRPEFVVMPEPGNHLLDPAPTAGDDWVAALSVGTTETDTEKSAKQAVKYLKSFPSDLSQSSITRRRRGMVRAISLTSRRSSRQSLSSRGSRGLVTVSRTHSIPSVKSEGHQHLHLSSKQVETLAAASLDQRSSSPHPRQQSSEGLGTSSNHSSPDLRLLASQQSTNMPTSPTKFILKTRQTSSTDGAAALISDAQSPDVLSPDILAERFRRYDDELLDAATKVTLLEEELVAFSSIRRFDIPFRYTKPLEAMNYLGSLRWRQLVACWKHSEMVRCMMMRAPSPHFVSEEGEEQHQDAWTLASTLHGKTIFGELELNGVAMNTDSIRPDTKNLDGFRPQYCEFTVSSISRFLAEIGKGWSDIAGESLCHVLSFSDSISIEDLLKAAKSVIDQFSSLVDDVATFASRNASKNSDSVVRFSVDIKDRQAIEKKARRKYSDDILQVKDVVRAQISFPDEGSLVCGLVRLFQIGRFPGAVMEGRDGQTQVEVTRIKNLFSSESPLGNLWASPLPTGYRHVLLNVRLNNGLLAEIQFNLSPIFDILGQEGYKLHQELLDLRYALEKREKNLGKSIPFDVKDLIRETGLGDSLLCAKHSLFGNLSSAPDTSNTSRECFASKSTSATCDSSNSQTDAERTPQTKNKPTVQGRGDGVADLASPDLSDAIKDTGGVLGHSDESGMLTKPQLASHQQPSDSAVRNDVNEKDKTPNSAAFDGQNAPQSEEAEASEDVVDRRNNEPDFGSPTADQKEGPSSKLDTDPCDAVTPRMGSRVPEMPTNGTARSVSEAERRGRAESERLSPEKRRMLLDELTAYAGDLSGGDVFLAILEHGSRVAANEPRDVATFYCLYLLFSYVTKRERGDKLASLGFGVRSAVDVIEYSRACLLRCLKVSNQAISTGMTGWLEYGCSSPLERMTERPFVVLRHLAYDFGRRNQWVDAENVLLALVVNCEQHLPTYHPTTLTALIDLAIAATMVGKENFAERIVSRVAERLSAYLSEMESAYLSHLSAHIKTGGISGDTSFRIEHGRESIFMLQAFVSLFQSHLSRDMVTEFGRDHDIVLANHCFLADSLSVLANCIAAAKSVMGSVSGAPFDHGARYWELALAHYQLAFKGFLKTKSLDDPSVSRAAYGIARCLREFGETEKALELLSLIVSSSEKPAEPDSTTSLEEPKAPANVEETKENLEATRFLPRSMFVRSNMLIVKTGASSYISSALCLWLMSILSLDKSPNEKGRERAFSYLHAASVKLQTALRKVSKANDAAAEAMCVEFLAMIEDEAMQIAEPIYE